jgi:hypothetical protein
MREKDVVPPSELNETVPTEIDSIVLRALTMEPEDRYQDVLNLRKDLSKK